ncbi:MAG: hypothetical protein J6P84_04330 [Alphaproteobacteria bacterium]|nr:hypothetical protein [Alphaproteobacteria bacterium]
MKKLQIIAWICFSLSCYSMCTGDKFFKLSDNEFIQYRYEPLAGHENVTIGQNTPTRIKTYRELDPGKIQMRDIQAISYTASRVNLFKDLRNNCCIDIYVSNFNPNKCRIVGENGRNIYIKIPAIRDNKGKEVETKDRSTESYCFSVYDVSAKKKGLVENENKLIFVDNSGTYIVSATQNPLDTVIDKYNEDKKFNFSGSVIKVSAIYGGVSVDGRPITPDDFWDEDSRIQSVSSQNSETKPTGTFLLNCSIKTPVFIGMTFAPVTKLYPAMLQIEEITKVKLISPPPSEKSVIKRVADILGVMADILTIKDGIIYLVDALPIALNEYMFDMSLEAMINRELIAVRPWDNI